LPFAERSWGLDPGQLPVVAGGRDLGSGLFGQASQDRTGAGADHAGFYDDDEAAASVELRSKRHTLPQ
jgi:hypothetical protein